MSTPLAAYRVTIYDLSCIVFAETNKQARWFAVKGWRDAGMGPRRGSWPECSARRVESYDKFPHAETPRERCWVEEYVRDIT
jgi:hypothetical protein